MKCIQQDDALIFAFCGDLDNLSILKIKADVIREIDRVQAPVVKFDFKDVTFIDSTGIGFLLARYNQVQSYRGELILKNISPAIRRLFALSGIFQIMRLENEAFARTSAVAFLMPLNPTVDEIMEIKTILAEAVVNCMIHGYQGREEGQVRVSVSYDETHRVTIEVQDSGVGIEDITLARQPLYTTRADLERSGMGMTIMESFSDEFEICSHPGEGTTVRLVKQLQFHE